MKVHLPNLAPGVAPGALYVRVCTVEEPQQLLDAHPLGEQDADLEEVPGVGAQDYDLAGRWLEEHPGDEVHVYLYDGDDGSVMATIILTVDGYDVSRTR